MRHAVIITVLTLLLSGCSFFTKPQPAALDAALVQGSVQAATVILASRNQKVVPLIVSVSATIIDDINAGKVVTMKDIDSAVINIAAKYDFTDADLQAAQAFIAAMGPLAQAYVKTQPGGGLIDISKLPIQICVFAQWVNNQLSDTAVCRQQLVTTPTGT